MRADARRNRDRILAAAAELFVDHGVDAPLDAVARRADVGIGTLYRHFPDRDALNVAVALQVFASIRDVVERVTDEGQRPLLESFLIGVADLRIGALTTSLVPIITASDPAPQVEAAFDEVLLAVDRLVDEAHDAGELREDVAADDLLILLALVTRPLEGIPGDYVEAMTPRILHLAIDGLRSRTDTRPLPAAPPRPDPAEIRRPS